MKTGHILVEGQTEERFVKDVLGPYLLRELELWLEPTVLTTSKGRTGKHNKGGAVDFERVERSVRRLLGNSSATVVTTLLDYYGLGHWPGKARSAQGAVDHAITLARALTDTVDDRRLLSFLAVHELEAYVFTDLEAAFAGRWPAQQIEQLRTDIRRQEPEAINDMPETTPGRRLARAFPGYRKALDTPTALQAVTVPRIRDRCPHFSRWLTDLAAITRR